MGKKILLADDSITIQKVIELTFSDEDFEVVTVGNGRLAIERIAEVGPDVVLCDIIMPEKDGYEVCDFIKKNAALAHVPVLLLTGAFEPFDQERANRVGADGYLAKPFEPQTLISKVKELLERGAAPRAAAAAAPAEAVRHATVPVPSETTPVPVVRTPPSAREAAPAAFEPLYAVEEPADFQPLEAAGGFEPLEAGSYEPLEPAPAGSPLDAFVAEAVAAPVESPSSHTLAFIPEEPLPPPAVPTLPEVIPAEGELVGEPDFVVEPEPEFVAEPEPVFVAEPEPEFVAEPEPASLSEPEPELVAEPMPELVAVAAPAPVAEPPETEIAEPEPDLAVAASASPSQAAGEPEPEFEPEPELEPFLSSANPPRSEDVDGAAATAPDALFEEAAGLVAEAPSAAPTAEAEMEAEVEFDAGPEEPVSTAEVPLEERARAAVEAAYGAVFAAGEPLAEEPPGPDREPEAVFEFETSPAEAEVSAHPPAAESLVGEDLSATAQPEEAPAEAVFEEAFESTPVPPSAAPESPFEELGEEPEPAAVLAAPGGAVADAAPPEPEPADEVSFEDVAPPAPRAAPEATAPAGPSVAAEVGVPVDMVAAIAQRVVGQLSEKVIREVAWEIIPELAEALIKKEIERLRAELDRLPK